MKLVSEKWNGTEWERVESDVEEQPTDETLAAWRAEFIAGLDADELEDFRKSGFAS